MDSVAHAVRLASFDETTSLEAQLHLAQAARSASRAKTRLHHFEQYDRVPALQARKAFRDAVQILEAARGVR